MNPFFAKREQRIRYETITIKHVAIGELRYVRPAYFDVTLPVNGAPTVFTAAAFEVSKPSISEDGVLSMTVQLGRIGTNIKKYMKQISDYRRQNPNTAPAEFTYSEYLEGDAAPIGSIQLWVSSVDLDGDAAAITASDDNPNSINVARRYLAQDFPGLEVII